MRRDRFFATGRGAGDEPRARQQIVEQIPIRMHVIHDQHLPGRLERIEPPRDRMLGPPLHGVVRHPFGLEGERGRAPLSRGTLDDEVTVHHSREIPADREPEPGTAATHVGSAWSKGSKIRTRLAASMPGPVSSTAIAIGAGPARRRLGRHRQRSVRAA